MEEHSEQHHQNGSNHESPVDKIFTKLDALPVQQQYPDLLLKCRPIIQLWCDTFSRSDPALWNRMRRAIPKELNESAFIIDEMIRLLSSCDEDEDENNTERQSPHTIIDMCSGVGYLSMFLSHLLPVERCSRIVPIDTLFQLKGKALKNNDENVGKPNEGVSTRNPDEGDSDDDTTTAASQPIEQREQQDSHLSTSHLTSSIHPIPIRSRKANIKKGRELRQIAKHCIDKAPGQVIILGVHLCKALSVHTVRLFNTTKASRLYLKPCCLPGRKGLRLREPPFWAFEHMPGAGLGVKNLYCSEIKVVDGASSSSDDLDRALKQLGREEKEDGRIKEHGGGGSRGGHDLFNRWTELLCTAVDTTQEDVSVELHHISVQQRHFQNQYIVAMR